MVILQELNTIFFRTPGMKKFSFSKYILLPLLLLVSVITIYSKFIATETVQATPNNIDEKFDEEFLFINTSAGLDSLVSAQFRKNGGDTALTVLFIDHFLRSRFYHTYSVLSVKDNWISVLCGNLFWDHFLFPVLPGDIIEYPMAACSQQGILFQQQLSRLNIPYSTIQFFPLSKKKPGHYAVSVYYGNTWHYYDPNREPYIVDSTMPSIERIIEARLYEKMYSRPSNLEFQDFFKNKSYKQVNMKPFTKGNMYYFQLITAFLSSWLWLILLLTYITSLFMDSRKK